MPITKTKFEGGKLHSKVEEEILSFLKERKEGAFTSQEIMAGIRYPTDFSTVKNVYPDIFLCHFRIGQKAKLKKLKKIVKNFGMPVRIDGVDFDKAVKIRVKLSGRLTENGKIKSITRMFWLVDSEPENMP